MAQRITTTLIDDLDGGEATKTLTFSFDGKSYQIDLNDKNAEEFKKALEPYIAAGRKVAGGAGGSRSRRRRSRGPPARCSRTSGSSGVRRRGHASRLGCVRVRRHRAMRVRRRTTRTAWSRERACRQGLGSKPGTTRPAASRRRMVVARSASGSGLIASLHPASVSTRY